MQSRLPVLALTVRGMWREASTCFQDAALRSIEWYETIDQRLALTPLEFAYSFMTRTGKVDDARIGRMDSTFLRQVQAERDAKRLTHPETGAMLAGR